MQEPVPWHVLCWTSYLATATGRMSQSSCVHGQKNGTANLMFLDEHLQISVKSPYLPHNQAEDFGIAQVQVENPTPGHWKPSIPVFTTSKSCSLSFSPTSVSMSSFHLGAGDNKHNLEQLFAQGLTALLGP